MRTIILTLINCFQLSYINNYSSFFLTIYNSSNYTIRLFFFFVTPMQLYNCFVIQDTTKIRFVVQVNVKLVILETNLTSNYKALINVIGVDLTITYNSLIVIFCKWKCVCSSNDLYSDFKVFH